MVVGILVLVAAVAWAKRKKRDEGTSKLAHVSKVIADFWPSGSHLGVLR